jgi:hypothetical protein
MVTHNPVQNVRKPLDSVLNLLSKLVCTNKYKNWSLSLYVTVQKQMACWLSSSAKLARECSQNCAQMNTHVVCCALLRTQMSHIATSVESAGGVRQF